MPELVYNVKFQIDTKLTEGAASISSYKEQIESLKEEINMLNNAQNRQTKQQRVANSQVALGNQLFFSLSDGVQDATQFSYGFASGMRAVGNNIGFTAELLGNFVQKTKEANDGVLTAGSLTKQLAGSFFGVGGLILALNLGITALTSWGKKSEDAAKKAKDLSDSTKTLTGSLIDLIESAAEPSKDVLDQAFDIEGLTKKLNEVNRLSGEYRSLLAEDVRKFIEESIGGKVTDEVVNKAVELFMKTGELQDGYIDKLDENQLRRVNAFRELISGIEGEANTIQDNIFKAAIALQAKRARQLTEAREKDAKKRKATELDVVSLILNLGDTELQAFIKKEEEKRKEAEKTAKRRAFYERVYLLEGVKVASEYSSVYKAHYGIVDGDSEESSKKQIASTRAVLDATGAFMSQLMLLNSQRSAQDEREAKKQFETNKKLAYASAVVAGSAAIVEVMRDTKAGLVGRLIASGLMAAAVGVQIAQIKQQQFGYGGEPSASGSTSGGSQFGFQMNKIEGAQTFRTPAFTPTNENRPIMPKVDVKVMADRKQLYAVVKRGEEEYRTRQA